MSDLERTATRVCSPSRRLSIVFAAVTRYPLLQVRPLRSLRYVFVQGQKIAIASNEKRR